MTRPTNSRLHEAFELIGRRWTGMILAAIFAGRVRYAEIKRDVPGLSDTMLAQRLRELEAAGLVERVVLSRTPIEVHYRLTAKGEALAPVLEALAVWAETWLTAAGESTGPVCAPAAVVARQRR